MTDQERNMATKHGLKLRNERKPEDGWNLVRSDAERMRRGMQLQRGTDVRRRYGL